LHLKSGTRLGPYELNAPLGAGGMGEVYRARDTRLDRTVAIKVLPAAIGSDPILRQRLEREARAISALDHPHICSLYDIGAENGIDYLVMQLVSGETLADRLARGPLTVDEVCTLGAQMADALAAAHRRGIVHRDLKPGNVMVTREGVKILDFGLAKNYALTAVDEKTMTRAAPLTGERNIVGTLQYMAPEQLEGRDVDPRTDIFALGAVLYEMVTGRRAFEGDSSASLIAAIMTGARAPVMVLAPSTPPAIGRLIDRCLAKDPEDRWQSAGDLAYALRSARDGDAGATASAGRRPRRSGWWSAVPVASGVVIAALGWLWPGATPVAQSELRLSLVAPTGLEFAFDTADYDPDFAVSPDGRHIAFVAMNANQERLLFVRDLASLTPREIGGTVGARRPFWSADGRTIAYFTEAGLQRVGITDGSPQPIPTTVAPSVVSNGTWTLDNRIIYEGHVATEGVSAKALFIVPERGGTAERLPATPAADGEHAQRYPVALPDGRHYLYLSWTPDTERRGVYLGSLDGSKQSLLVRTGFRAGFAAPDSLVYIRDGALVAQRLDVANARLFGDPRPIATGVALEAIPGQATFQTAVSGAVAFRSRSRDISSELRWVDRQGRTATTIATGADVAVSLDAGARRVAVARINTATPDDDRFPCNVWLLDLVRNVATRFTVDPMTTDENPVWSPSGDRIAYAVHRGSGLADVRIQSTAGAGASRVVASGSGNFHPIHWSRDGTLLLHSYATGTGSDDLDLFLLGPEPGAKPRPFVVSPFSQAQGQFSPDGDWVAYSSNESGQLEVYVRPRDGRDLRAQISAAGGGQPRWRADGRELYYVALDGTLMAVPIRTTKAEVTPGVPVRLFTEPTLRTNNHLFYYGGAAGYDVAADGSRFLVNRLTRAPEGGPIHMILNWLRP
jgi:Tol biopolymer transport system component